MTAFSELLEQRLKTFSGTVPVLELENCVLLPESVLSLRITATADCQLIAEALAADAFVAVSLKRTSGDPRSHRKPSTEIDSVCLASIVAPCQLESGDYSLLLQGICRAKSVTLQNSDRPYRKAILELKPDFYVDQPVIQREHRQFELLQQYASIFLEQANDPTYYHMLQRDITLGKLCDILAGTIKLEPVLSQLILQEHDVDLRSDLLLSFLKAKLREQQRNPFAGALSLEFSQN
ncbi:LON peptidase substrate-binding domain-containing protein [Gimesia fumaroli]|uniref:Lon protease n=1 Tax=Gimesia fumaroli TaxID=2527976 RepID=A0A518IJF0_9PLAN|nr:LON peptidase substrate-binding domain-containing protein [Gimesia fumaroli]QDV53217.1 Lon protease [Gimesia fumaroli]